MRLILFDMDGTLIDSQAHIIGSMVHAFHGADLPAPSRADILSIVGLSLPQAMFKLAPDQPADIRDALVEGYKVGFVEMRGDGHVSPLYDGALACLETLAPRSDLTLGIATGKSRRGVDAVFEQHDLAQYFVTVQVADDHPSKPHPAMAQTALLESGADAGVMIGDTTYDMQMGQSAGLNTLGVTWGYHSPDQLAPYSDVLCHGFSEVIPALDKKEHWL